MKHHGSLSLLFSLLPMTTILTTIFAYDPTFHAPTNEFHIRRDFETCQETYGGGSENCGDADDHFCYDPTLGESCCLLDNGYCKLGNFCAPVSGYCCHDGENPDTCAQRLSFTLPPSASTLPIEDPTSTYISVPTLSSDTADPSSTDLQIAAVTTSSIDPAAETEVVDNSSSDPSSDLATAILVDTSSLELASPTGSVDVVTATAALTPDVTAPMNASASALQVTGGAARLKGDFGVGIGVLMLGVVGMVLVFYA